MDCRFLSRLTAVWLSVICLAFQAFTADDVTGVGAQGLAPLPRPLCFTENRGQWDERVLYKAEGAGGLTYFIERDGFTLLFSETWRADFQSALTGWKPVLPARERTESPPSKSHALKFKFIQSSASPSTNGWSHAPDLPSTLTSTSTSARLSWNNNYFLGNNPSRWAPNCGNFGGVTQHDVWKDIDVEWYESNGRVEFDFVVKPGTDPSQVGLRVDGLTGDMEVTGDGEELLLPTSLGTLRFTLPEAYQAGDGSKANPVPAHFTVTGANRLSLALPEGYDAGKKLIVDPLVYSTYLGGGDRDYATTLAPGQEGSVVVAGYTYSNHFPMTAGAYDRSLGGWTDVFISEFSSNGNDLLFSTYLGGRREEASWGISIKSDETGKVNIAGVTESEDFPTSEGAFDRSYNGGYDVFIAQLSENGSQLLYGTYYGGSNLEEVYALDTDYAGEVVVTGDTKSDDFPTTEGAYDRSFNGNRDIFVARLSMQWGELVYSTYIGGEGNDYASALAPDGDRGEFVAGQTNSHDFPTTEGAYNRSPNGEDEAFITHLNRDGSALTYSTFLGGGGYSCASSLVVLEAGEIAIAGGTESSNFPTTEGAFDRSYNGDNDAFIAELSGDGNELIYATYLGGQNDDWAYVVVPDSTGGLVITGGTASNDFPTSEDALDRSFNGGFDAFVARLSRDGSELVYSTYFGGSNDEKAFTLMPDGTGGVIMAGMTSSSDLPTTNGAFDRSFNGSDDAFMARIDIGLPFVLKWTQMPSLVEGIEDDELIFDVRGESYDEGAALTLTYHSHDIPNDVYWFDDNGDGSGSFGWDLGYDDAGHYNATFTLSDSVHEISADVAIIIHNVNNPPNRFQLDQPPDHTPLPADSLVTFAWNHSIDYDADTLTYLLKIVGSQDSLSYETRDTTQAVAHNNLIALLTSDSLRWEVLANDGTDSTRCASVFTLLPPLGVGAHCNAPLPAQFALEEAYPNPFNSFTTIRFSLKEDSKARLTVYDLSGRAVATLASGELKAGSHTAVWNAEGFASGIYLVRMETPKFNASRKMTLLK